MIGFVHRIVDGNSFCFIRVTPNEEYFAHRRDFVEPKSMKVGQYVSFDLAARLPGKNPAATNVVAIERASKEAA